MTDAEIIAYNFGKQHPEGPWDVLTVTSVIQTEQRMTGSYMPLTAYSKLGHKKFVHWAVCGAHDVRGL